ncbi:hypothetical protein [Tenacibaculum xiamenense]|uniref:hypothetical protein n=1 Tax=Tenacibaculum xiamenense TaxID=1261553 RepID=UPI0038B49EB7
MLIQTIVFSACGQTINKGLSKSDYSFGLKEAKTIKNEVLAGNYAKADEMIKTLSSDNLSQTMDCLALNIEGEILKKWYNQSNNSESSTLAIGVYHSHKGWKIRGYAYSNDVDKDDAMGFIDYQEKSKELLNKITKNKSLVAEAKARLIRVYMSLDEYEKASLNFQKCIQLDPNNVWAYIHQSESIQPKWGGSQKDLNEFLKNMSKNKLIQQIITLKLTVDSFISDENLFDDGEENIKQKARKTIREIDKEIEANSINSIHKYLVFGYMVSISHELGDNHLLNKYYSKMDENYPLYPFGIIE